MAVLLSAVSCMETEIEEITPSALTPSEALNEISLSVEMNSSEEDSRVEIDSQWQVSWSEGESLLAWSSYNNSLSELKMSSYDPNSSKFEGTVTGNNFRVLTPYDATATVDDSIYTVDLSSQVEGVNNTYMVSSDVINIEDIDSTPKMKHVGAVMTLNVTFENVESYTAYSLKSVALNDVPVATQIDLSKHYEDSEFYGTQTTGSLEVELSRTFSVSVEGGTQINFNILPFTVEPNQSVVVSLTFEDGDDNLYTLESTVTNDSAESVEFNRSTYNSITLSCDLYEILLPGESADWRYVRDENGSTIGYFTDDILSSVLSSFSAATKEVQIQESTENPGYYRIKNLYTSDFTTALLGGSSYSNFIAVSDSAEIYTYIDATDPDAVWIERYNTGFYMSSTYGYYYYGSYTPESNFNGASVSNYGKLENGYISFPASSMVCSMSIYTGTSSGYLAGNGATCVILPGGIDPALAESVDYSKDGEVTKLHSATKGSNLNGVNFVLMADGYQDVDMEEGGVYESLMEDLATYLIDVEPMKSYAEYINIYAVKVVSKHGAIGESYDTALSTYTGTGTSIGGNDTTVFAYANKVGGLDLSKTVIAVMANSSKYSGTTYTYSSGHAIGYTSVMNGTYSYMMDNTFRHEVVGHGFGKLVDEYIYYDTEITTSYKTSFNTSRNTFNMGYNLTIDETDLPWEHFLDCEGYDMVQNYEGGYFFQYGVWRSEYNSCMNDNVPYFSAISRELMVKRILSQAGETYSFDDFVEKDVTEYLEEIYTSPTKDIAPFYLSLERSMGQLPPPVLIEGSPVIN